MMKFSALNEASLSDDDGDPELATREAQEEEAYLLYHQALKKQSDGDTEDAEKLFREILEMEFLAQVQPNEEKEELPLRPALTLKYLLFKNLATISNDKKDYKSAVEYFLEALEIDSTDVIMWFRMGKAALNISNFPLARLCFEEGLRINPNHWPSMDNVITVMYALNDYSSCLFYIAKALEKECYYLKGLAFKDEIYKEDPSLKSFCESYFTKCDTSIHYTEYDKEEAQKLIQEALDMREKKRSFNKPTILPILSLSQPIKELTWKALGDSLVNMYDVVSNATPSISFNCKIDLSQYGESTSKIADDKLQSSSPISSLSEACSSNSTSRCNVATLGQKSDGLLQLAIINNASQSAAIENNPVEMELDDAPSTGNSTPLQNTYLVLPQIETTPTDLSLYNDSPSSTRRTSKRKRLLSELSDFSSKRRSTRVRNPALKKPHDNVNYQELLQKFLPSKLIGDGKFEEQDEDSETASMDKGSDLNYGQSSENEKNGVNELISSEKEDVNEFLKNNQSNSGIIDLLYKYIVILGSKSSLVWPKGVIDVYCSAFQRLRKHITVPNIFSRSTELCRIREMGLAILVFCEFKVDKWYLSTGHTMSFSPKGTSSNSAIQHGSESVGNDFHSDMEFLVHLTVRRDALAEDWLNFSIRALWLKAKFHSLEGEVDLAVCCMGKLCDVFSDEESVPTKIILQNISASNIITASNVQQQLESLQRCQSLEEVQRLYEHKDYAAVVDLLVLSFNQPRTKRKQNLEGIPERHAQLLLLQNSLWNLERYKECVYWSEVSFNEALQQFMNAARSDWSETMAQLLQGLDNCAKINSDYLGDLEESKLVRLTQNLILVIVIQMENYDFSADNASLLVVLPWIILYRLILNEEKRKVKKSSSKEKVSEIGNSKACVGNFLTDFDLSSKMPSSLMLLFTAHEYLGRRSWCTAADGLLLLHCIDVMMADLQDVKGNSYLYREDLETGLEQCIYCLYGHPHKRTRAKHLQEHNSRQITLTWERAATIFQYFKPNVLPEFDSYRTSTISAELESLLKRITSLVPPDEDPTTCFDTYTGYIEGAVDKCPDPPFGNKTLSPLVKDLYYLLGDYYFKNKEFSKAIRLYMMDICINPDRQDSWAGMALSRSSQLDQKLNSYELRNESTIYRKSSAALRCFEHALELDPTTTSLWIEHGSLAYILHSHASRQLKQDTVCDELGELLRKKKTEMLQCAKKCFKAANHVEDGGEPEEAWLHHYMLGKIAEKEGLGPPVYLNHYQKALMYLHEDFARYPQKILYHNPAELSIEVLEVYYRLHASCLKFLWKHEVIGTDLETLKTIKRCLNAVKESPFAKYQEKCKKEISYSTPSSESEEYVVAVLPEPKENVDHTYFGDSNKAPKKISGNSERRQSRPSTDSSPEAHESASIKEVMDSLVGVVAERFVDEELEKAQSKCNSSHKTKNPSSKSETTVVQSFVEECVYTSNQLSETMNKQENDTEKELKQKMKEEQERINRENEELAKMQTLAMELETEAAASKLVEEMNLQNEEMDHYDYSGYGMYDQKQEDHDSAYYESAAYEDDTGQDVEMQQQDDEKAVRSSLEENERAVQSLLLEENKVDEPMYEETEMAVQSLLSEDQTAVQALMDETEKSIQPLLDENEKAVQSLVDENEKAVQSLIDENEKAVQSLIDEDEKAVQSLIDEDEKAVHSILDKSVILDALREKEAEQSAFTEDEKAVMSIIDAKDNNDMYVNESEKDIELAFEDDNIDGSLTIDFEETPTSAAENKDELFISEKKDSPDHETNINESKFEKEISEFKATVEAIDQPCETLSETLNQPIPNDENKASSDSVLADKKLLLSEENKKVISSCKTEKDVEIVTVLECLIKTIDDSKTVDETPPKIQTMDVESKKPIVEANKTLVSEVCDNDEIEILDNESFKSTENTKTVEEHESKSSNSNKDVPLNDSKLMQSSSIDAKPDPISDSKEKSISESVVNPNEINISKEKKLETATPIEKIKLDKPPENNAAKTTCDKDKTKVIAQRDHIHFNYWEPTVSISNSRAKMPKKLESNSSTADSSKSKLKKKKIIMTLPKIPPSPEELLQSQSEIAKLIPVCLDSLREVLQRFIQHYKALYRMAHYFCHSKRNKNLQWAREILLAATPPSKRYPSMPGLFADRKNTNLFNGIWRGPSIEIDRPGSFGAHMYRSVHLLIEVLTQQKDYNMLVYLSQQLYRTPDLGKKYMRDTDRVVLVREAYDCCVNILRDQMNSLLQEEPPPEESRLICCLLEIYRSCQTLLKAGIYVDETNELLVEAYTMYRIGEVDPYPSVLEQATKFCQLQLGKSCSQDSYGFNRSKYAIGSDMGEVNTSLLYSSDPLQKELAKSHVLPTLPCEARNKVEVKSVQEPVLIIPIDTKFSNVVNNPSIAQCSMISPQMVHVEKPKAENLQACSVAFLPVASMYPKETTGHQNVVPSTSLLSCQAFECFDVLTTLMQASGYQVAHQSNVLHKNDSPMAINLHKSKTSNREAAQSTKYKSTSTQAKVEVNKPKRRKRKASTQKMEGLNLCKRISTKPIVSSTIANSIAEIKVPTAVSSVKKSKQEPVKSGSIITNFNQTSVISKTPDFNPGVSVIVKSPISMPQLSQASDTYVNEGIENLEPICLVKGPDLNKLLVETEVKDQNSDFIDHINDSLSFNIEASIIESCAKEILDYITQKVEDAVMQSKLTGQLPLFFDNTFKISSNSVLITKQNKSGGSGEKRFLERDGIVQTSKSIEAASSTYNDEKASEYISEKITSIEDSQMSESLESEQNHFTEIINDILNNAESCDRKQKENASEVPASEIKRKSKSDEERKTTVIIDVCSKSLKPDESTNPIQIGGGDLNSEAEIKPTICKEATLTGIVADEDDEKTLENEDNSQTIENGSEFKESELKLSFESSGINETSPDKASICSMVNEENSNTMDADLKEEPKLLVDFNESQNVMDTTSGIKCEISDELSKDSSTQFVICCSEFEEDDKLKE